MMQDKKRFNIHSTPYVVPEVENESTPRSNRISFNHNRNISKCVGQDFPKLNTLEHSISNVLSPDDSH
jgi:hypothetical protein